MNAIALPTLPDETAPVAEQMRALSDLVDYAMRMARLAVEQYEAAASPSANSAVTPSRRQPDPGSLFIRLARIVLNGIFSQSRLAAGLPAANLTVPRARARQASDTIAVCEDTGANPFRQAQPTLSPDHAEGVETCAEPVRRALRTATRNHPHGQRLLRASLENLATVLTVDPRSTADMPGLLRRICNETGIHLNPSQWRRAARDLTSNIRAAPA